MYHVVFFGTSQFAVPILERLAESKDFDITLVVTQDDEPQGRKKNLTPTPVKQAALRLEKNIYTPKKIKDAEAVKKIVEARPDFLIVAAYGQIIPKEIIAAGKYGAINVHPSLLPRYRGASPVQFAILHGEANTGTTIMLMDSEVDHGPVLAQEKIKIYPNETTSSLKKRLAELSAELLLRTIPRFARGEISPQPQNHAKATFTKIIKREDGHIDWKKRADEIYNMARAFDGWPGIFSELEINSKGVRIKFIQIKIAELPHEILKSFKIGEVFQMEDRLFIKCGEGAIEGERLQREGKNEVSAKEFLQGYKEIVGALLG